MTRRAREGWKNLGIGTALVTGFTPIILCFGILASDPVSFARKVLAMAVICFITSFISIVAMQLD